MEVTVGSKPNQRHAVKSRFFTVTERDAHAPTPEVLEDAGQNTEGCKTPRRSD